MSVKSLRDENAEKTRAALMAAARELFAERGYADVSAEEIVKKARVTRGALYHHFKDKQDLFEQVCEEVGAEIDRRVLDAGMPLAETDPWRGMLVGIDAFLDACTEGAFHRIVLVDAPAVAGWDEWRKHAEAHMLGLIRLGLQLSMDAGAITKQPVDVLAAMVFSILNEGGMLIGHADDRKAARKQVGKTIHKLMDGLRA
jgi:AcrR family transcriptional regulator